MTDEIDLRMRVAAFLSLWPHEPTEAELRLWVGVLEPYDDHVDAAFATWARANVRKPVPREIVEMVTGDERLTMLQIASLVAVQHGITLDDLRGGERSRRFSHPRQQAMAAMAEAGFSSTRIGRFLGSRDHTTVLHGIAMHRERQEARHD